MRINKSYYDKLRELEEDGFGVEVVIHGQCRSTIRGTPAERLRWRQFLNELFYQPALPRHGRCEVRDR